MISHCYYAMVNSFAITAHPEVTFTSTAVTAAVFFFFKSRIQYEMFKSVLNNEHFMNVCTEIQTLNVQY